MAKTDGGGVTYGALWRLRYNGPALSWLGRLRVWFWLKRCERKIKRAMNEMGYRKE